MEYVHYGAAKYNPEKFKPIRNRRLFNKPYGGLWASPIVTPMGMKKTDLLEIISAPTLAKISKGKNIQTDAIDKICLFLECQPGDIMECFYHESEADEFGVKVVAYNEITSVGDDNEFEETDHKVDTRALPEDFEKSEKRKAELLKKHGLK